MVTAERMKDLELYVKRWKEARDRAQAQFDALMKLKKWNVSIRDSSATDILNERVKAEDQAIKEYQRAVVFAESTLGRAQSGEDV
jgi:hypothetical protein